MDIQVNSISNPEKDELVAKIVKDLKPKVLFAVKTSIGRHVEELRWGDITAEGLKVILLEEVMGQLGHALYLEVKKESGNDG